jgi:hypothetical protein
VDSSDGERKGEEGEILVSTRVVDSGLAADRKFDSCLTETAVLQRVS